MTILLLGGAQSQTSLAIVTLLEQSGLPYILASRSGALPDPSGIKTSRVVVKFDYFDPETYSNPFESLENTAQITAIWSFVPKCPDPEPIASRFIDFARSKGVERFVFIAGGNDRKGAPGFGKVWEKLSKDAEEGSVQYAVLVPSLFMDNFRHPFWHLSSIREESKIYTATEDGKAPFISVRDIGRVGFKSLTSETPPNTAYLLHGPALLSADTIAATLSKVLGREIIHVRTSVEKRAEMYVANGVSDQQAGFLAQLEGVVAKGLLEGKADQQGWGNLDDILEGSLETFEEFAVRNKDAWEL